MKKKENLGYRKRILGKDEQWSGARSNIWWRCAEEHMAVAMRKRCAEEHMAVAMRQRCAEEDMAVAMRQRCADVIAPFETENDLVWIA